MRVLLEVRIGGDLLYDDSADSPASEFHRTWSPSLNVVNIGGHLSGGKTFGGGKSMIARIWHGKTKASDATAYLEYLFKSGIPAYRATRGNKGAWVLRRIDNDIAHFITLSFWESQDAIAAFAGADIGVAKYYPEDEKYLLEFEPTVTHYDLFQ